MVRWFAGWILFTSFGWTLDSVRVVYSGRPFTASTALPVMNMGYLFFITRASPELDVFAPDGHLAFAVIIQGPAGVVPFLFDSAIDDQGRLAVGVGYKDDAKGYQGGIALLDATGKQTGLILTGPYMPSHLCFGKDGSIWARGWQRDAAQNDREDRQDYSIIRRFEPLTKQQTGAFISRSSFPPGLSPGGSWGGKWGIRAAGDRIGVLMFSGKTSERLVWLELDSSGTEVGRWTLPPVHTDGLAFSQKGLYAVTKNSNRELRSSVWELDELDKTNSAWKPISKIEYSWDKPCNCGVLMDADADQLVLAEQNGAILEWIKP